MVIECAAFCAYDSRDCLYESVVKRCTHEDGLGKGGGVAKIARACEADSATLSKPMLWKRTENQAEYFPRTRRAYEGRRPPVIRRNSKTRNTWRAADCVGDELGVGPQIEEGGCPSDGVLGSVADGVIREGAVNTVREGKASV